MKVCSVELRRVLHPLSAFDGVVRVGGGVAEVFDTVAGVGMRLAVESVGGVAELSQEQVAAFLALSDDCEYDFVDSVERTYDLDDIEQYAHYEDGRVVRRDAKVMEVLPWLRWHTHLDQLEGSEANIKEYVSHVTGDEAIVERVSIGGVVKAGFKNVAIVSEYDAMRRYVENGIVAGKNLRMHTSSLPKRRRHNYVEYMEAFHHNKFERGYRVWLLGKSGKGYHGLCNCNVNSRYNSV